MRRQQYNLVPATTRSGCIVMLLLTAFSGSWLNADEVTLQVKANNPAEKLEQKVTVKSYLSAAVKREDIVAHEGLECIFDENKKQFYVYKELTLAPGEEKVFEVTLNDVWEIDQESLAKFKGHAEELVGRLNGTEYETLGAKILANVDARVTAIVAKQEANSMANAPFAMHVSAYQNNTNALNEVKEDVGLLENYVWEEKETSPVIVATNENKPEREREESEKYEKYRYKERTNEYVKINLAKESSSGRFFLKSVWNKNAPYKEPVVKDLCRKAIKNASKKPFVKRWS